MTTFHLIPGYRLELRNGLYVLAGPSVTSPMGVLTFNEAKLFADTVNACREVSTMQGFLSSTEALIEHARSTGQNFPNLNASAAKVRREMEKLEAIINIQGGAPTAGTA